MFTKLIMHCPSNHDYNGTWDRDTIENEIFELIGNKPLNDEDHEEWIEWTLNHCIDDDDIDASIINAISMPNVSSISYLSKHSGMIEIRKMT